MGLAETMIRPESSRTDGGNWISQSAEHLRSLFDRGHRLTKEEAGEILGRHPRTITRLVRVLREAGVPVQEERSPLRPRAKRFFLDPQDQRRGITLGTLDESAILALTIAAQASEAALAGTPLRDPLRRAFAVLLPAIGALDAAGELTSFDPEAEHERWHFGALAPAAVDPDTFTLLRRAADASQSVRMDYMNGKGTRSFGRMVDPLAFAPVKGAWLLAAYCHTRDAVRDFNLARISNVRPLPSHFFAPPREFSAQAHFAGRFGALEGGEPVAAQLLVSPERAVYFESRLYHASQESVRQPDGSLLVTFRVPNLDDLRAFVASWGPHVLVTHPPELRDRLATDAAATVAAYAPTS